MTLYRAALQCSEESILKLTETQYATFHSARKLLTLLISLALLLAGFSLGLRSTAGILFLFFGSVLITGINTRPRATAKTLIRQLGGKYPSLTYVFTETGLRSENEASETEYSSILALVEDRKYFYIYVSREKAYMLEISTVTGKDGAEGFKTFMTKKTSAVWTKPFSLFSFDIRAAKNIRKIRKTG